MLCLTIARNILYLILKHYHIIIWHKKCCVNDIFWGCNSPVLPFVYVTHYAIQTHLNLDVKIRKSFFLNRQKVEFSETSKMLIFAKITPQFLQTTLF